MEKEKCQYPRADYHSNTDSNLLHLTNWRPITLLNLGSARKTVDNKTLFPGIKNYHTQGIVSYQGGKRRLEREDDQADEQGGKQGDPEFFLKRGCTTKEWRDWLVR